MQTQRVERSRTRRSERRERVEAKHHPEAVFGPTEGQALSSDLAVNEAKNTQAYYAFSDHFALEQQNGRAS